MRHNLPLNAFFVKLARVVKSLLAIKAYPLLCLPLRPRCRVYFEYVHKQISIAYVHTLLLSSHQALFVFPI